jgi:hypothetical protein
MPINPAYQFMNSAADLSDKNQFMDFLRRDDRANNNYSDYSADLGNAQDWANTMAAQQPQPAAQPRPMPQPQQAGSRAFTRPMPQVNTQIPEVPEQPQPEVVENVGQQGFEGLGNFDELPMTQEPQSDKHTDLQNQELQRFEQTKLARQGRDMGMDPRQLMVALAQFSAGMGNIKGKDTRSTAADFYNMQKGYEAQDEARKMRQEEFAARMAPKPVDPLDIAQKQATIEYLKRKGMPQPAAPLDPMKQKLTEARIANLNARTKNELLGSERGMPKSTGTKGTGAPTIGPVANEEIVQVPGWQKTQNVPIEKAELKQFRDRSAKVPRVIEKIEKLKSLITKYGAYENPYGEAGVLMRQLNNDLKLDLKGPEFKALGVLAGPDMDILEALIPDPSSWQNAMRGDKSVTRSLDALRDNLQKDIEAGGRQLGFSRESAAPSPMTTAPTGSTGLPVYRPGGK